MEKRRRKRKNKIINTKVSNLSTINREEERKKFPKKLVEAFLNLNRTKIKVKENGIKYDTWTDEAYELYNIEARKYLGAKADDNIENSKLVVLLSRATMDVRYTETKK